MPRLSEENWRDTKDEISKQSNSFFNESIANAVEVAVAAAIKPLILQIDLLSKALEDTKKIHEQEIANKDARISTLEQTIIAQNKRNLEIQSLMLEKDDLNEQYSRKDCLRISGIPISKEDDNDAIQTKVINSLSENGVEIEDSDIHRMHRSGKPQSMADYKKFLNRTFDSKFPIDQNDNNTETVEVIVRFTRWAPRSRVYSLHYKKKSPASGQMQHH